MGWALVCLGLCNVLKLSSSVFSSSAILCSYSYFSLPLPPISLYNLLSSCFSFFSSCIHLLYLFMYPSIRSSFLLLLHPAILCSLLSLPFIPASSFSFLVFVFNIKPQNVSIWLEKVEQIFPALGKTWWHRDENLQLKKVFKYGRISVLKCKV